MARFSGCSVRTGLGKTTTIRLILGLHTSDFGQNLSLRSFAEVGWLGDPATRRVPSRRLRHLRPHDRWNSNRVFHQSASRRAGQTGYAVRTVQTGPIAEDWRTLQGQQAEDWTGSGVHERSRSAHTRRADGGSRSLCFNTNFRRC